jgi:hypothetical protein
MPDREHVVTVVDGKNGLQFAQCNDLRLCKKGGCAQGWKRATNPSTQETVDPVTLCVAPATLGELTICMILTSEYALELLEKKK